MLRIPLPLVLGAAVAIGVVYTIIIIVAYPILGSYDTNYAYFNGSNVVTNGTFPNHKYVYLYGGYGIAYFTSAVTSVVSFECAGFGCLPGRDFGRYMPVLIEVVSGSLPSNTNIVVNQPYGNTNCKVVFYFDTANMVAYIGGTSTSSTGTPCAYGWSVPMKMYKDPTGRYYWLYPLANNYGTWSTSTACSVISATGATSGRVVLSIPTQEIYSCVLWGWGPGAMTWYTHASSATVASLPNPSAGFSGWITQTISGSGYTFKVYYAPLFFMQGPQPFVVDVR
jgi:hypothetical protein